METPPRVVEKGKDISPVCNMSVIPLSPAMSSPSPPPQATSSALSSSSSSSASSASSHHSLNSLLAAAALVSETEKDDRAQLAQATAVAATSSTSDFVRLAVLMCKHIVSESIKNKTTRRTVSAAHCHTFARLVNKVEKIPRFATLTPTQKRVAFTKLMLLAGTILKLSSTVSFSSAEEDEAVRAVINVQDLDRLLAFRPHRDLIAAFDGPSGDAAYAASFWCIFLDFLAGGVVFDKNNNNHNDEIRSPQTISFLLQQHMPEVLRAKVRGLNDTKRSVLAAAGLDIGSTPASMGNIMKGISSNGMSKRLKIASAGITTDNIRITMQSAFEVVFISAFKKTSMPSEHPFLLNEMCKSQEYTWPIPSDMWHQCETGFLVVIYAIKTHVDTIQTQLSPSKSTNPLYKPLHFTPAADQKLMNEKCNAFERQLQQANNTIASLQAKHNAQLNTQDTTASLQEMVSSLQQTIEYQKLQIRQAEEQKTKYHQQVTELQEELKQLQKPLFPPEKEQQLMMLDLSQLDALPIDLNDHIFKYGGSNEDFSELYNHPEQSSTSTQNTIPRFMSDYMGYLRLQLTVTEGVEEVLTSIRGSPEFAAALPILQGCETVAMNPANKHKIIKGKGVIAKTNSTFNGFQPEEIVGMHYIGQRPSGRTPATCVLDAFIIMRRLELLPFACVYKKKFEKQFTNDFYFHTRMKGKVKPKEHILPVHLYAAIKSFVHIAWEVCREVGLAELTRNQVQIQNSSGASSSKKQKKKKHNSDDDESGYEKSSNSNKRAITDSGNVSTEAVVVFELFCEWLAEDLANCSVVRIVPRKVPRASRFLWLATAMLIATEQSNCTILDTTNRSGSKRKAEEDLDDDDDDDEDDYDDENIHEVY